LKKIFLFEEYQAARYGNLEDLKTLYQENQSNCKIFFNRLESETKLTALHYAARFNHYEICRYLIEQCEADVNKGGDDGMKPLHYIARFRVEKDTQVISHLFSR
jgi:ankyrin repeat protein